MKYYDEQLQKLQEQITRKRHLDAKLNDLKKQQAEVRQNVEQLNLQHSNEQKDVDKLEGKSLSAFFYAVIGQKSEQLSKERREAYEAKVRLDTAIEELNALDKDIISTEAELSELDDCEIKYSHLLTEKAEAIKANDPQKATELLQSEEYIARLKSYKKEVSEAIYAGKRARETASATANSLYRTEELKTYATLQRNMFANIRVHDNIDSAQTSIETLQVQLRKFKAELADVSKYMETNIRPEQLTGFANSVYNQWFGGLVSLKSISETHTQLNNAITQIDRALYKLSDITKDIDKKLLEAEETLKRITLEY